MSQEEGKMDYTIINIAKRYNCLIIGGLAKCLINPGIGLPKDYDIIFPHDKFHEFCIELGNLEIKNLRFNKHGGLKFVFNSINYDIWSDDIQRLSQRTDREWVIFDINNQTIITKNKVKK